MKLLLRTPVSISKSADFAAQVDMFDPTFSKRYLDSEEMEGFSPIYMIVGEKHWEADKYNILFMDCDDDRIGQLVDQMRQNGQCELIAPVDEAYEVNGEPLYIDQDLVALLKKQGREMITANVARREAGFKLRASPQD